MENYSEKCYSEGKFELRGLICASMNNSFIVSLISFIVCNYFQRGKDIFIETFDIQFKPPLGVTPVFRDHGEKMMQVVTEGTKPFEDLFGSFIIEL